MGKKIMILSLVLVVMVAFFLIRRYMLPPAIKLHKLQIEDESGKWLSIPPFPDGVNVIVVWATWCPPCVKEMPIIQSVYDKYLTDDKKVSIYAISDEPMDKLLNFKKVRNYTLPMYHLKSNDMHTIGVYSIPCTFILKNNQVKHKHLGDWKSEEEMINVIEKFR